MKYAASVVATTSVANNGLAFQRQVTRQSRAVVSAVVAMNSDAAVAMPPGWSNPPTAANCRQNAALQVTEKYRLVARATHSIRSRGRYRARQIGRAHV